MDRDGIFFREASRANVSVSRSSDIFDCRVLKRQTRLLALLCATIIASARRYFPGQTQELIAEQEQARQDALGFGRNSAMGYPPPGYGKGRRG